MENMEKNANIKELLELRNDYEQEKLKLFDKKEALIQKKKEIYMQVIENIKNEIDSVPNNERLQKYLEATYIKEFEFLFRSLIYMPGNNQKGSLDFQELLLLDDDVKSIGLEYKITSGRALFKIFCDYNYYHKSHPFLENDKVLETMEKATKLAYLDEIFKNIDNILNYQGAYVVYSYVKRYLKEVLKDEMPQTDKELIYKDYNQKLELVLANLSNIASYLLDLREQIPNSRLALCNQGLSRTAKKLDGTSISFKQNIFAEGVAFGTTFKKLKDENYEDAKRLIFLPHQKLLK